jgi:tetratricopeptide (TPR) repeat protein
MAKEIMGKVPVLPPPSTPLEQAQWLCFEAFEHRGRRRIQLARQALGICPDAADAYCLLAEQRGFDTAGANELFRQGMEAGRRALGEEPFNDPEFPFWGAIRSRPYMRARQGFAQTLVSLGRKQEAADEFQAMLKLNPNDNQGVRYELAPLLLELNRLDELDDLLGGENFQDDGSAEWAYVRALLAFRRTAGGPKAKSELVAAIRCNPHVPKYLLGRAELPPLPPQLYSPGDEREAMIVALSQKTLWERIPQAIDWLSKCKRELNQNAQRKKSRRRR